MAKNWMESHLSIPKQACKELDLWDPPLKFDLKQLYLTGNWVRKPHSFNFHLPWSCFSVSCCYFGAQECTKHSHLLPPGICVAPAHTAPGPHIIWSTIGCVAEAFLIPPQSTASQLCDGCTLQVHLPRCHRTWSVSGWAWEECPSSEGQIRHLQS